MCIALHYKQALAEVRNQFSYKKKQICMNSRALINVIVLLNIEMPVIYYMHSGNL